MVPQPIKKLDGSIDDFINGDFGTNWRVPAAVLLLRTIILTGATAVLALKARIIASVLAGARD
jgi:hypothetical protein